MKDIPAIYFYLPQSEWPKDGIPDSVETHWWLFMKGTYCWTIQTYLRLQADGFPCKLVGTLPDEGIVLAHRDSLPDNLQIPGSKLFIICLKAERDPQPEAQIHVVQNSQEASTILSFWDCYYIPLWPQPGLIPRNPGRGDRFENLAYFGLPRNLAPELQDPAWEEQLQALGLRWRIISSNKLVHDYSEIDVVLAVRSFDSQRHIAKPATKLFNGWHAGVPVIGGAESALQAERQRELDYIEVTSIKDTLLALQRLRDDVNLRQAMVENGRRRAAEIQVANLTAKWREFLMNVAIPAYENWCMQSSLARQTSFIQRYLALKIYRIQQRISA
ncbi:glycosyltransferase [Nostoc sp. TCL26-01]|uniref:glycosyltransferase n=1 Tax=Nostoc sp. TCL26-01 TaxID=2576904 RepID=UPI0015BEAB9C|nr:glycosyltransferase [Nostoc sp. TCL26-01]QLE59077.1 hypothetical protein FD725_28425 [Nostoc sp. TCL26-01]